MTPPVPDEIASPYPQAGPAYLRGYLARHGHDADLVDLTVRARFSNRFRPLRPWRPEVFIDPRRVITFLDGGSEGSIEAEVRRSIRCGDLARYPVVGFSLLSLSAIAPALCIARVLKERFGATIVLGGAYTTRVDLEYLLEFEFVDHLVKGDGGPALVRLLRRAGAGSEGEDAAPSRADGLCSRLGTRGAQVEPCRVPLSARPPPSFCGDDVAWHRRVSPVRRGMLPYLVSRGCRYKCAFCSDYPDVRYEYVPADQAVEDLRCLQRRHDVDCFYFCESNLTSDPAQLGAMAEAMLDSPLDIRWGGLATAADLDERWLRLYARAGCRFFFFGAESGERSVLDRWGIRKVPPHDAFIRVLRLCREVGISTHLCFIVGFPGEGEDEFARTKAFLREAAPHVTGVNVYPFVVMETAPIGLRPARFGLRLRERRPDRYRFLFERYEADLVGGPAHREIDALARRRVVELQRHVLRHVGLRSGARIALRSPGYLLRKYLQYPYRGYDMYLDLARSSPRRGVSRPP